jgi:hypothetical protein
MTAATQRMLRSLAAGYRQSAAIYQAKQVEIGSAAWCEYEEDRQIADDLERILAAADNKPDGGSEKNLEPPPPGVTVLVKLSEEVGGVQVLSSTHPVTVITYDARPGVAKPLRRDESSGVSEVKQFNESVWDVLAECVQTGRVDVQTVVAALE